MDGVAQVLGGLCSETLPMMKPALMVGLGEVLWDLLPSGKIMGGAPANFAYMANALGDRGVIASRIGVDPLGEEAYAAMVKFGLNTQYLQRDQKHETGSAKVAIDEAGQPIFTIKESASWDFLEWTPGWQELAQLADVVCFGSLAQRSPVSAATVDRFLRNSRSDTIRIFDVNLRQSYYTSEVLKRSLQYADIVKLTDQELIHVTSLIGMDASGDEERAKRLLDECDLRLVCITRGSRGSVLVSQEETVEHPGFTVRVVDAVGAGDAFTACLAHHLIRGRSLEEINEFANRLASWVVTQVGATPPVGHLEVQNIITGIGKEEVQPGWQSRGQS
jgi:fructokinase